MLRSLTVLAVAVALLATSAVAGAAAPAGFSAPRTVGANLQVTGAVAASAGPGPGAAVAFADASGGVWAARVRADGTTGSPLPAASGQRVARDVQVAVTDGTAPLPFGLVAWRETLSESDLSAANAFLFFVKNVRLRINHPGDLAGDPGVSPRLAKNAVDGAVNDEDAALGSV